ncbi:hypothetical protein ACRBEV_25665 [Methylobacterium phyllosphaerae]
MTEAEIQALCDAIISLEAQCDFLLRVRQLYSSGPQQAKDLSHASLVDIPQGYGLGANGQLVATSTEAAQCEIQLHWPVPEHMKKPRKRFRQPGDEQP